MKKCVRLKMLCEVADIGLVRDIVEAIAREQHIEGSMFVKLPNSLETIVVGDKDRVDTFLDSVQRNSQIESGVKLLVEAAHKDRDFRGVFRIIE